MQQRLDHTGTIVQQRPLLANRFEVLEPLGEGAAGAVFRVRDRERNGNELALKVLLNATAFDEATMQRFLEELNVLQTIRHPNLVEAYDLIRLEDGIAYTMEFVRGRDLAKSIKEREFSYAEIDRILVQVLGALDALHSMKVLHRDLKLENILLRDDGTVKLADLGLMKRMSVDKQLTRTGILLGTAQYMPPEYVKKGHYDERSDIYALGLVMYELVAKQRYLAGMHGAEALDKLLAQKFQVPIPSETSRGPLPEKYRMILEQALAVKPLRRYQTALQMRQAFEGGPSVLRPASGLKDATTVAQHVARADGMRIFESPAKGSSVSLKWALFLVIALAAIGYWWWSQHQPHTAAMLGRYSGTRTVQDGNMVVTRPVEALVSERGLELVLGFQDCRRGLVDPITTEVGCEKPGFRFAIRHSDGDNISGVLSFPGGKVTSLISLTKKG